jgi:hypothetical protein
MTLGRLVFKLGIIAALCFVGLFIRDLTIRDAATRIGSRQVQLVETWNRWTNAGKPSGLAMVDFLRGRNPDISGDTNVYEITAIP